MRDLVVLVALLLTAVVVAAALLGTAAANMQHQRRQWALRIAHEFYLTLQATEQAQKLYDIYMLGDGRLSRSRLDKLVTQSERRVQRRVSRVRQLGIPLVLRLS